MPVLVSCPHCSVQLNIPENLLGKKVRCATCSQVFEAVAPEPVPATAPHIEELPEAPLDEARVDHEYDDNRRRPERTWRDEENEDDDDEEDDDRLRRRRSRRGMRRDLVPHRGSMILTMGILSTVLTAVFGVICCLVAPLLGAGLGIPAVIMGHADIRQIRAGNMDPDGEGQTRAGLILGYIGIGLAILLLLGVVAYVLLVVLASTTGRVR